MGHDMPGMGGGCSMSMLFNADPTPCVLFESWHIQSGGGLFFSMVAIALLGVFYEWSRLYASRYDRAIKMRALLAAGSNGRRTPTDEGSLGASRSIAVARGSAVRAPAGAQLVRSLIYVFNVALSFVLCVATGLIEADFRRMLIVMASRSAVCLSLRTGLLFSQSADIPVLQLLSHLSRSLVR